MSIRIPEASSELRRAILKVLLGHGGALSVEHISAKVGVTSDDVGRELQNLAAIDFVRGVVGVWTLTQTGRGAAHCPRPSPQPDRLSFLHFTDLHAGMPGFFELWPGVYDELRRDLVRLSRVCGPWDVVAFTGDLAFRGAPAELAEVGRILRDLWELFDVECGCRPRLAIVPGNHDLVRPTGAAASLMERWHASPPPPDFWNNATTPMRRVIDDMFAPFTEWSQGIPVPTVQTTKGLLPGEFSTTLPVGGRAVGLVGLNTSFLHTSDAASGRLHVDVRQFHAACAGDAFRFSRHTDATLLLTHHPAGALSRRSRNHFYAEIHRPRTVAVHLHGHGHAPSSVRESRGFGLPRRKILGASLFGLERRSRRGSITRIHGYAAGEIVLGEAPAKLRLWPRLGTWHEGGHDFEFGPSPMVHLEPDGGTSPDPIDSPRDERLVTTPAHISP